MTGATLRYWWWLTTSSYQPISTTCTALQKVIFAKLCGTENVILWQKFIMCTVQFFQHTLYLIKMQKLIKNFNIHGCLNKNKMQHALQLFFRNSSLIQHIQRYTGVGQANSSLPGCQSEALPVDWSMLQWWNTVDLHHGSSSLIYTATSHSIIPAYLTVLSLN